MYFFWQILLQIDFMIFSKEISVNAAEIVEKNGKRFITGKGCGILKPIRVLSEIPENIEDFECSIISADEKYETFSGTL